MFDLWVSLGPFWSEVLFKGKFLGKISELESQIRPSSWQLFVKMILGVICKACHMGKQWPLECKFICKVTMERKKMYFMCGECQGKSIIVLERNSAVKRGYVASGDIYC